MIGLGGLIGGIVSAVTEKYLNSYWVFILIAIEVFVMFLVTLFLPNEIETN